MFVMPAKANSIVSIHPFVWCRERQASRSCLLDQVGEDGKTMWAVVMKEEDITGSRRAVGERVADLVRTSW